MEAYDYVKEFSYFKVLKVIESTLHCDNCRAIASFQNGKGATVLNAAEERYFDTSGPWGT